MTNKTFFKVIGGLAVSAGILGLFLLHRNKVLAKKFDEQCLATNGRIEVSGQTCNYQKN